MRNERRKHVLRWLAVALLAGSAWGCVERDAVYVDQAPWEAAFSSVTGFLGYRGDPAQKVTQCAGCHEGYQEAWARTGHARAWDGLQKSGHAQPFCEACHAVSSLGNRISDPKVGWVATQDPRFVDVQCESCHGPGAAHVSFPKGNLPLASIAVPKEGTDGCGGCHYGAHHPFVEQWAKSAHGKGPHTSYAGGNPACARCHEGKAALEVTFGAAGPYAEKGSGELLTITCAVCHDPHGSTLPGQLRASITAPTRDNLCMRCHTNRGTPWSARGPHAAQGFLLLRESVGYIPAGSGIVPSQIPNPHGLPNNEGLCTTCHVQKFTVTDAGGAFVFQNVGHTFAALPCLDEKGIPDPEADCSLDRRYFQGCTGSGCHGSVDLARAAYLRTKDRLNSLLDQLWVDSNKNRVMDITDAGLLPQVLAKGYWDDLNPNSSRMTPAKGALWNAMLAWTDDRPHWSAAEVGGFPFSSHPSSGNGVHNPHLLEALLLASIGEVRSAYGLR